MTDEVYGEGVSMLDDPLLDTSDALVTAEVDFLGWFNNDLLAEWWILHDLAALLLDGEAAATPADGPAIWAEVTATG